MTETSCVQHPWFWVHTTGLLLQRSRRLSWLGCSTALVVGGAVMSWSAAGAAWPMAGRAALTALPFAWAGIFAAAAIAGTPGIRHRTAWAVAALLCSLTVLLAAAAVL